METDLLDKIANKYQKTNDNVHKHIVVCAGTGCISNGSLEVFDALKEEAEISGYNIIIDLYKHDHNENEQDSINLSGSGCQGFCGQGPLVTIFPDNILYVMVKPEDAAAIINKTIINHEIIEELLYVNPTTKQKHKGQKEIPFYYKQSRTVLKNCGVIDPGSIEEYIYLKGYYAARQAVNELSDTTICDEISKSYIRGRGGGGFPTGLKWDLTRKEVSDKKYVICNGDEGDPGAFMDRSLMEGDPHAVIEGMIICAKAIGADEGYVYVRMEYPLAVSRMRQAIKDAEAMGFLGDNIFDSDFSFKLHIKEGAGAFVCGEETALMASIEGGRGMPWPKPPFPAQKGLWGQPTVINNVETLATIPLIIRKGADWFLQFGTEKSKGTKIFALTGHIANTGLIEVPFGMTLREIIFDIGGGVTNNKGEVVRNSFKAIQIGGPSGGCLTKDDLDIEIDYDNLTEAGAMVGSGGLVVLNDESCMISVSKFFMEFTQNESCGKCVPCREGTKQMLAMLNEITEGTAEPEIIGKLESLAKVVKLSSLCGLGKTAPNPILSTLNNFRSEYDAHIIQKYCATSSCTTLASIEIIAEDCVGCTICARECPVDAITGSKKEVHIIDPTICIKCGICDEVCNFDAIKGF